MTTSKKKFVMTAEFAMANFKYDPENGAVFRLIGGELKLCTHQYKNGYIAAYVGDRRFAAHRIAWACMTGEFPKESLDHIDGNTSNNMWVNLREATPSQNMCNSATKRMVHKLPRGVMRVTNQKTPSFLARIQSRRRNINLGVYPTPEEASEVYQLAAEMLHGQFAYHLGQGVSAQKGGA